MNSQILDGKSETTATFTAAELLRRGVANHKQGLFAEAASLYQRALDAEPRHADAIHLLGVIAYQRGDHETAVQRIRQAIAINAGSASFYSNLGIALRSLGRKTEAVDALSRAAAIAPTAAGVRYNLANALKDLGQFAEAIDAYRCSLDHDPRSAAAWTGLGDVLRAQSQFDQSRRAHEKAIALSPRLADAHYNLGLTLKDEGDLRAAIECFLRAASLSPQFVGTHVVLGNVYEDLGDFRRAIAAYDRALRLNPILTLAQFNRALALLRQGNFADGWNAYESRWRHNAKPRIFAEPEWDGSPLCNQTILVYSEQGIGDEVMFASCFREMIAGSQQCLIECDPRLVRLFSRSFPAAKVFPRPGLVNPRDVQSLPQWSVQIATGSLPRRLRPTIDSFPRQVGYLTPDPEKVMAWRARYDRLGAGLTVGVSWEGGKDPAIRRRRSTSLGQWAPLFRVPGIAFVNLQYGDCDAQIEECRRQFGMTLHDWDDSDPLRDLDGFAAQIAALDLVITVDNSTAHLAGALNTPVWILLHTACDWRWLAAGEDSPWYASVRLFRQRSSDRWSACDWDDVFHRASSELAGLANKRAAEERRRGTEFHNAARLPDAIEHYRRTLALCPDDAKTLNDLGVAWRECGRPDLAAVAYRRAIEMQPNLPLAWFNLGNARREEGQLEEAVDCYQRARQLAPGDRQILVNLSIALRDLRRLDESLACLDEVLQTNPELPEARFDRSLILLLRGELEQGWNEYDWRLSADSHQRPILVNRWNGTPLADRSALILAEQGIGDQVMFASCLPDLARSAKTCVIECDPRLVPLFARSFPDITVVAKPSDPQSLPPVDRCDVVDFIGSLPKFVRRRFPDFPATDGYLRADPDRVAQWQRRFARLGSALKVGISWHGGKDAETQRKRSASLALWGPIFQAPGVRFINLQYGPKAAEASEACTRFGIPIDDGTDCDPLTDLDDFTAKIAALDLVVSIDNSTVHLAAAIGRPVWTLLPFSSDWRWGLTGETTPWYPTMRLLRCRSTDGWAELLQRTGRLLTEATFSRGVL